MRTHTPDTGRNRRPPNRRSFLGATAAVLGGSQLPAFSAHATDIARGLASHPGSATDTASNENFWAEVARAFTVDRTLVNLNNGGVSPSPSFVQEAMKRHLDYSNKAPTYTMWRVLEPQREGVRARMAREWGVDTEEVAFTRNASEGLQTCQFGYDLEPGDEVLTTTQDYGRMLTTFRQRERREGIVMVQIRVPVPAEDPAEVVRRFEEAITPRTRLILVCHMINLTGQILPVREIVRMARGHEIPVIVDGAHALAHFPFKLGDLDCDNYSTSLHKWLFAPHGTGLLYVRREKIPEIWPLMAAVSDRMDERHPQVRGDRHAPRGQLPGHRRGADLPPGDRGRAQGGAADPPARLLGEPSARERPGEPQHQPEARLRLRDRERSRRGSRPGRDEHLVVERPPDHHDADRPRGVHRAPDIAERVHDARGARPLLRGHGVGDRARAAVATPRAPGRARRGAGILRRMLAACARGRVAVVAAAVLATAGWVRPHTELKATDPKADGVLDASPAAVTLTYTTVVRLALSTVTVRSAGEDGARVAGRLAYLADDRRDVLVLPLDEPLPPGSYTVAWTTAGPDGHRISGEFGFRVEPPAAGGEVAAGEVAAEQGEPPAPPDDGGAGTARPQAGDSGAGQVLVPMVVRFLFHGGIAGVVGAVTFRLLVLGQCARSGESGAVIEAAAKRAGTLAVLSLGLLLATLPMRLWHQAGTFFPRDAAGNLLAVLHGSAWAAGWWLQLGAVLVLAGGAVHLRRGGAAAGGWAGVALGALLLPFVPVLSGHGWADTPRAVSAAATYLHVVAAGAWMGGLACLLLAGLPGIRGHGGGGAAGRGRAQRHGERLLQGRAGGRRAPLRDRRREGLDPRRCRLRSVDHRVGNGTAGEAGGRCRRSDPRILQLALRASGAGPQSPPRTHPVAVHDRIAPRRVGRLGHVVPGGPAARLGVRGPTRPNKGSGEAPGRRGTRPATPGPPRPRPPAFPPTPC